MNVEIDTTLLLKNHINANQFMLAYLLFKQEYTILENLIQEIDKKTLILDIKYLEDNRFIHNLNLKLDINSDIDFSSIIVRNKFSSLFKADVDLFEEFLSIYPVKVQRPDGFFDYLRTDIKRCKRRYNQIVAGKLTKHERLIEALKYELKTRELEGSMMYMKRLPKWLSSEDWKIYEERMNDKSNIIGNPTYGTTIE